MGPSTIELQRRLDDLTTRVAGLERALGIKGAPTPRRPHPVEPTRDDDAAEPAAGARDAVTTARPPSRPRTKANAAAHDSAWLEQLIGGRLFAIAGAAVVILATALFLKLAWDMGWLGAIPDPAKALISAAFGVALLGAGEVALRRIGRAASAGLSAAGLGALYATAYACFALFDLVGQTGAFALLAATAALGLGVTARSRLATVGTISVVGGFAAPFLLGGGDPPPGLLPTYWGALLLVALALTALLGQRLSVVRAVAWWLTILVGGGWALANANETLAWTAGYVGAVWAAVHAELLWACLRGRLSAGAAPEDPIPRAGQRSLMASVSTTVWATLLGVVAFRWSGHPTLEWMAPAGLFVAAALASLPLAGGLRALRDVPRTDGERLGALLAAQAGALLLITATLALRSWTEPVALVAIAVAAVLAGRWLRARSVLGYGLCALAFATFRAAIALDLTAGPGLDLTGLWLTRWTAVVAGAGGAWLLSAWVAQREGGRFRPAAPALTLLGAALLAASLVHMRTETASLVGAWTGFAIVFALARPFAPALMTDRAALALLAGAAGAWYLAYVDPVWSDGPLLGPIHEGLVPALAVAAAAMTVGVRLARRSDRETVGWGLGIAAAVGALALALASTSLEAARLADAATDDQTARRAAVSIWWGVFALPLLIAGFVRRLRPVRFAGLALMGAATVKAVAFDMAGVAPGWRVATLLGLGLLLLAVATAYAKVAAARKAPGAD